MKKQKLFFLVLSVTTQVYAQTNLLRSYDINFRRKDKQEAHDKHFTLRTVFGIAEKARNNDGDKVSSPQYLFADQNALAMLKGMGDNTEANAIAQAINADGDTGVRGHYIVTGDYNIPFQFVLAGHYHWNEEWTIGAHLPFYHMKFDNIVWENQTKTGGPDDAQTRELLTNNFFSNVSRLGDNLNLQDWSQYGAGDLTTMISWSRHFFQNREWLKEVTINARGGVTFPLGVKKNVDKAFSLPFGNDGAYTIPFGAGIDLRFKKYAWVGINVTFDHIFSHTKVRRIMTHADQTNYLLLQKANTRKEYGFVQMFNVYIEPQISDAFSLRFAYAHSKIGDDKLFVLSEDYSSIIANKNIALEEGTTHDFVMQCNWDAAKLKPTARFKPQGSIFAQIPFKARGSLQSASIGFSMSATF